jgi:division protein CdvB (Snf7/Vps24/ESCRT-III family)
VSNAQNKLEVFQAAFELNRQNNASLQREHAQLESKHSRLLGIRNRLFSLLASSVRLCVLRAAQLFCYFSLK